MNKTRLFLGSTCLAALFSLTNCSAPTSSDPGTGTGGSTTTGGAGTTGNGGSSSTAGTSGSAGAAGSSATGTAGNGTGGSSATGTAGNAAGAGGDSSAHGGTTGAAGTGATGTAGNTGTGGNSSAHGGTTGTAGTGGSSSTGTAGSTGAGGTAGTGVRMDQNGVPLAMPGAMESTTKKYLNLGDMRLINNRWGSDATNCSSTQQKVYVNSDKSVAWDFNRQTCDSQHAHPDFPEVEFGIAPFGTASSLTTTPTFSSTTLLPIQIKNLTSASVNVNNFFISISNASTAYWDNNVEFWISRNDPRTSDGGVYAEIISFVGFQGSRLSSTGGWPCDKSGSVTAGSTSYNLCHQSDSWSSGWRFFNFNVSNGPFTAWTSKLDVKAMLTWIMNNYSGFTGDMWLTRIEVGTEVDDKTAGTAKISGLTFEINGTSKSFEFAQ
jgi:hypothetical protein